MGDLKADNKAGGGRKRKTSVEPATNGDKSKRGKK